MSQNAGIQRPTNPHAMTKPIGRRATPCASLYRMGAGIQRAGQVRRSARSLRSMPCFGDLRLATRMYAPLVTCHGLSRGCYMFITALPISRAVKAVEQVGRASQLRSACPNERPWTAASSVERSLDSNRPLLLKLALGSNGAGGALARFGSGRRLRRLEHPGLPIPPPTARRRRCQAR